MKISPHGPVYGTGVADRASACHTTIAEWSAASGRAIPVCLFLRPTGNFGLCRKQQPVRLPPTVKSWRSGMARECRWLRRCSLKRSGSGQLRSSDTEDGCRHRFIATEGGDGLAALRMPLQAATPDFFLRGVRFPRVHARLRVVELGALQPSIWSNTADTGPPNSEDSATARVNQVSTRGRYWTGNHVDRKKITPAKTVDCQVARDFKKTLNLYRFLQILLFPG